jgi:isoquinoline 1-oxidoreductase beta subunit
VNPDRVRAQIEGAAVMAATQALFGGVSFKSGRTVETNFNRYKMLRMHNAPREVFVDIVDSQAAPAGVGEIGVPSFAPALCNAIFSAVGVRIRNLPVLTPQGKWRTPYLRQQSAD